VGGLHPAEGQDFQIKLGIVQAAKNSQETVRIIPLYTLENKVANYIPKYKFSRLFLIASLRNRRKFMREEISTIGSIGFYDSVEEKQG
jgi:hypothetical protein